MTVIDGNGSTPRDVCAGCGSIHGIEPFEYHAYRKMTSHAEVPKSMAEVGKIFQGRSVYHDLVQLSAPACARCVWRARWLRLPLFLLPAMLFAVLVWPLWAWHEHYMGHYEEARDAMNAMDITQNQEALPAELKQIEESRLKGRIFVEEQGRLQRAKDEALLCALPLRWGSVASGVLAAAILVWGAWYLRWENMGRTVVVAAVRPSLRRQGLKNVRPGHLEGGQVIQRQA